MAHRTAEKPRSKSETFRNVAIGVGVLAVGAGVLLV